MKFLITSDSRIDYIQWRIAGNKGIKSNIDTVFDL